MDDQKARYAKPTSARTLGDIIDGADVFFGLSAAGVLKPEMVARMARRPLILALANPDPEIKPEDAKSVRPDAIIATGRSDYPNQVNNVLCFPFIFRGALDAGATTINEAMKLAAVRAIADLAQAEQSDIASAAYGAQDLRFGPDYLIPRPFDPRLMTKVAPAVAEAAIRSGVATRPLRDLDAYRRSLQRFVYTSGTVMQPVFAAAAESGLARIVFAEGEERRVLRAAQVIIDERLAAPILVGRPQAIEKGIVDLGLRIAVGRDIEVVSLDSDAIGQETSESERTRLAAAMVRKGDADGMLCGTSGTYAAHLAHIEKTIGLSEGAHGFAAMNLLQLPRHTLFICDTYVHLDPTAEDIAEMTLLAAAELKKFGLTPHVALVSHSSFGTAEDAAATKMRDALALIVARAPDLEVDGEMNADAALNRPSLQRVSPKARLTAEANLLVMPNLDAANITFNALKVVAGQGISVGPILLGARRPVHILTPTVTVRGIVNMTALTAVAAAANV
jgi:malate dehydrogenase (oxaloacetate-decarboxylating)(NADP+)